MEIEKLETQHRQIAFPVFRYGLRKKVNASSSKVIVIHRQYSSQIEKTAQPGSDAVFSQGYV